MKAKEHLIGLRYCALNEARHMEGRARTRQQLDEVKSCWAGPARSSSRGTRPSRRVALTRVSIFCFVYLGFKAICHRAFLSYSGHI